MSDQLSFDEACEALGKSREDLEALVASGEIPATKEGDELFFTRGAIDSYSDEPSVLLSDEEINLLEDDDDVDFGIDLGDGGDAEEATDELDLGDIDLDTGETDELSDPEETVLNMDLIEDDGATTPLGGDDDFLEDSSLGEDTLLDTDVLDLGEEDTDTFDLDTAEETLLDPTEEGSLLRGGGARVMQMKRKKAQPAITACLAVSGLILLLPLSVLLSTVYLDGLSDAAIGGPAESWGWIREYNYLDFVVKPLSGLFR